MILKHIGRHVSSFIAKRLFYSNEWGQLTVYKKTIIKFGLCD